MSPLLLLLSVSVSSLAATGSVSGQHLTDYVCRAVLFREAAPIRIDGDLSDWATFDAPGYSLDNVCVTPGEKLGPPSSDADLSASFRCVADPENFYVAVHVMDDSLVFGEEAFHGTHRDDSVEVYFDGDASMRGLIGGDDLRRRSLEQAGDYWAYDANDAEIRCSRGKDGKARLEGMGLFGDRLFDFPGLWESLGIEAAIRDVPGGYSAELKVPKDVFVAVPLRPGVEVGFQVMVNDDDSGGNRDSKISWTADGDDTSWRSTRYFGRLKIQKYAAAGAEKR